MAVLLSWGLVIVWTVVGLAALNASRVRGAVPKLLLAPTVGFGAIGVLTFIVLQFGITVGTSAAPIGIVSAAVAALVLWRTPTRRAALYVVAKRYAPFAAALVASFVLTSWPLFRFEYDWVANGNDDMANYCIGAVGFQTHGFLRLPTPEELATGEDITRPVWFVLFDPETLTHRRCGSELTLAVVATWTGLTPQQVFMSVLAAMNVALTSATAGLVLFSTRRRVTAVVAAVLLALSSQTTYGVVQQLIGQVSGLALLCTSLALVTRPVRKFRWPLILRRGVVCGAVFAGLVVFYPETVPFLVLACVLLGVRDLVRRQPVRRHIGHAVTAIAAMAALVPTYLYGVVFFLIGQTGQGTGSRTHTLEIFPFFMTPRGPALVWGLLPSYATVAEPRQTVALVLGLVLLGAVVVIAFRQFRRGRQAAAVLVVMTALATVLYLQQAAFGLFKIAMFMQPFLWATVAVWVTARRRRWVAVPVAGLVVVVAWLNAQTQYWYVKQSTGHDSMVDLPAVTQQHLMTEFHARVSPRLTDGSTARVLFASDNIVLTKLLAVELRDVPNSQLAPFPYQRVLTTEDLERRKHRKETRVSRALDALWVDPDARPEPWVIDPDTNRPLHQVMHTPPDWRADPPDRVLLVGGGGRLSIFNRHHFPEEGTGLVCAPLSTVQNFAVLRDATEARQSFLGMDTIEQVALCRLEPDPIFPRRSMAGVGKHLVFDVINPSPRVRVLLSYTASFHPDTSHRTPPAVQIVGATRTTMTPVGDGAARLVSAPLAPQQLGASSVLALTFDAELFRNPNYLRGIERLWGAGLPRDRRHLTGNVRDVSVISEEEYAAFRPPAVLTKLPDDLTHPHLEYSGLYEHGWVSKTFKVRLTQPEPGHDAVVRGQIPTVPGREGFRTQLTVLLDGTPVETRTLGTGDFEIRVPAGAVSGPRWLECRFTEALALPAPDGRPAVALLRSVGFEPADVSKTRPPEHLSVFPADLSHPKLAAAGIDLDGWVGTAGRAHLWFAGPARDVVVRGNVPLIATPFRTEMTVLLDGAEVAKRALASGDFEVRVPVGAGPAGPRRLECRFSAVQQLPAPDTRATAARLTYFGFEPTK